ncbi:interferon-induced protein 44-like [Erpetoichthys calabaricus]|uniref:interferon-induced protein 44-like n=1 Tax=Erpetoichthys calabaricus TaxID=27687 RepID=UPI0022346C65|nr:interferon-induced protein 44-like [Erpetoichthys calabaricus]
MAVDIRRWVTCGHEEEKEGPTMARITQRLDKQSEAQLFEFFTGHVKFSLLHKASVHGFSVSQIQEKCAKQGHIMLVAYQANDIIVGVYSSKGLVDSSYTGYLGPLLPFPWQELIWTTQKRSQMRDSIVSYKPPTNLVTKTRVLLVGLVGAGKSSFISSIYSVLEGAVTCQTIVGTEKAQSFTTKFTSYNIKAVRGGEATSLVLCDMMGMGDAEVQGVNVKDVLEVIKGHVPERYKFNPSKAISQDSTGYVSEPTLKHKIACVVFVFSAKDLNGYSKTLLDNLKELQLHIRDLGVPLVAVLTHTDEVCHVVDQNASMMYFSSHVQDKVHTVVNLFGLPLSCIFPVKNYSSKLMLDCNTDILIFNALEFILRYTDLFYEDCEVFMADKS